MRFECFFSFLLFIFDSNFNIFLSFDVCIVASSWENMEIFLWFCHVVICLSSAFCSWILPLKCVSLLYCEDDTWNRSFSITPRQMFCIPSIVLSLILDYINSMEQRYYLTCFSTPRWKIMLVSYNKKCSLTISIKLRWCKV